MKSKNAASGIINTAETVKIDLIPGEPYGLVVGVEGDNFTGESITAKLADGSNTGVVAQGTLTIDTQPTVGDKFVIGQRTYEIVAEEGARPLASESYAWIRLGADLTETQENIVAAINGDQAGDFHDASDPLVTAAAFAGDASVISAKDIGTAGNAIALAETFTAPSNVFDAALLGTTQAGTDVYGKKIELPQIGSTDSAGSPVVFASRGMVEFDALLPVLLLEPTGAPTNVNYTVTRLGTYKDSR